MRFAVIRNNMYKSISFVSLGRGEKEERGERGR